jgi:hypothetical protein
MSPRIPADQGSEGRNRRRPDGDTDIYYDCGGYFSASFRIVYLTKKGEFSKPPIFTMKWQFRARYWYLTIQLWDNKRGLKDPPAPFPKDSFCSSTNPMVNV